MTTIRERLAASAEKLFMTFESVVIAAEYVQSSAEYVAGGDLQEQSTTYEVRLIRSTKETTLHISGDIPLGAEKYLMLASDLPVEIRSKDFILIDSVYKAIVSFDSDAGDIVNIIYTGAK
ncbi:MAG: hypothetical protein GY774_04705 [Planctomycetes bacterium]|nr:hypothetical protein [Planctomycetota bacterium]